MSSFRNQEQGTGTTYGQVLVLYLRQSIGFLIPFVIWLVFGALLLLQMERGEAVLWLNQWHTPARDELFRRLTWFGDGLFWALVLAMLIARSRPQGLLYASGWALASLVIQLLKQGFHADRPIRVLGSEGLQLVSGVELYSFLSFPSGHTGAAFSGFFLLALWFRKTWISVLCFLGALAVGVSRIYLVQHFFIDVYFGSLIGTAVVLLWLTWCRYRQWFWGAV